MRPRIRIILAGGGTGGHVFPALYLAEYLKKEWGADCIFIGTKSGLESRKVPQAGFLLKTIWISGLKRSLSLSNLLFPVKLMVSLRQSKKELKNFKPDLVIGTGGYVCGPVLYQSTKMNIPTAIQEQNSYPGITTKLLASRADVIFTAYKIAASYLKNYKKLIMSGNPVRTGIENADKISALKYFNLPKMKTVLVFGGSQGSVHINNAVSAAIDADLFKNTALIWQVGERNFTEIQKKYEAGEHKNIRIFPFIDRMDYAYSISDLAICRAGAMTISELSATGVPAVLIPFPYAAENHQYKNAQAVVDSGGAKLIKDDKNLQENLRLVLVELLQDKDQLEIMSAAIRKLHNPRVLEIISKALEELLEAKKSA